MVGAALGVANYALGVWPSLGRSMVLQIIISATIGYPLVVIGLNEAGWWFQNIRPAKRYGVLVALFFLIGLVGSEVQLLADYLLFNQPDYYPFRAGGVYLFNGILTTILGFMTLSWAAPRVGKNLAPEKDTLPAHQPEEAILTKIPLKKGDAIVLKPLEEVSYFEAYDNYSFLHDDAGQRSLCNYSLAYLETRLDDRFLRIHRKYLINKEQVTSIAPHLKGRFVITFTDAKKSSLVSSAGFSDEVKALFKI